MNTHIIPSQNDFKERIIAAAKTHRRVDWTCPKSAIPGDRVFFYVGADGLVAFGKVKSRPEPSEDWPRRYAADIGDIHMLETYIHLSTIQEEIPDLGWARYPRSYVTLSSENALKLDSLIEKSSEMFTDFESDSGQYIEGAVRAVQINAYERSSAARKAAVKVHGAICAICSFNFGERYGSQMEGFIHVHHIRPLNEIDATYRVNPKKDLIPICPNCHAVIHSQRKALTVSKVKSMHRP